VLTETHTQDHVVMSEKREGGGNRLELIMSIQGLDLQVVEHSQHQDKLADPLNRLG